MQLKDVQLNFEAVQNAYAARFPNSDAVKILNQFPTASDLVVELAYQVFYFFSKLNKFPIEEFEERLRKIQVTCLCN
jgi:hypothetical protein